MDSDFNSNTRDMWGLDVYWKTKIAAMDVCHKLGLDLFRIVLLRAWVKSKQDNGNEFKNAAVS